MDVFELRQKTGCSLRQCKEAVEYAKEAGGDEAMAIAYLRAKSLALKTNCSFEERVKHFMPKTSNIEDEPTKTEPLVGFWEKDLDEVRDDGEIYDYRCSVCAGKAHEGAYGNCDDFSLYCPHCGALMEYVEN